MSGQPQEEILGFLQLCADRRYHRKTMDAFEAATGLTGSDRYWIEATAGGSPAFDEATLTARFSYDNGARVMGWAAHGTANDGMGCGGFPGRSDVEMKAMLEVRARERVKDFPDAEHWFLFGHGGTVDVSRLT